MKPETCFKFHVSSFMILDGKKLAEKIKSRLAREIKKAGIQPGLASILVGDDPASALYISIKEREAKRIGIHFEKYHFQNFRFQISDFRFQIIKLIKKLNADSKIHGILVQLPLPKGFDTQKIINAIDPRKDVDGFHPKNVEFLKATLEKKRLRLAPHQRASFGAGFISPPHGAILALIKEALSPTSPPPRGGGLIPHLFVRKGAGLRRRRKGLNAVILANSKTFAEPLKILLEKKGIQVWIIYNNKLRVTDYELRITKKADIIIVAKGKPKFITAQMIKRGAIVIDVGTNRLHGKLVGDVDFEPVSRKAGAITPVPGGVGPMTVAMLLKNTAMATKKIRGLTS